MDSLFVFATATGTILVCKSLATVVAVALVAYGALMYSRPAEEKKTVVKPAGDVESVGGDATE